MNSRAPGPEDFHSHRECPSLSGCDFSKVVTISELQILSLYMEITNLNPQNGDRVALPAWTHHLDRLWVPHPPPGCRSLTYGDP